MAKLKIGCGWYVLTVLGIGIWAANKWAPNHLSRAKSMALEKVPRTPRSSRPMPSPAPTAIETDPSPEPAPSIAPPLPTPGGLTQTEDIKPGAGREAALGQTVRVRCIRLGSGGENLGGSSDFVFMLGAEEVAPGLERAVLGMMAGGKRRTTIPKGDLDGLLPPGIEVEGEGLSCEIELTEVL